MASSLQNASIPQSEKQPSVPRTLALRWKVLISVALLAHLTAVIAAPMAVPFGDAAPSQLQRGIASAFSPYLDMAYLDHGYRFFAPAPSPGHLVRYQLVLPDGTTNTGIFPDLKTEWPRLYYHRFFMLSEKLNRFWDADEPAPTDLPEEHRIWQLNRNTFLDVAHSYAQELFRQTGAKQVTLELVRHELPSPDDLLHDRPLTTPSLYHTLWSQTYKAEPL
ncbi:MAG TPA: hypothetical protein VFE46_06825 [Pirellulales bacterium]|jgi:hypothetical protein|nr:hypothetical protein [Pirellulales bacterium]